jgi:hypothetical protein
LTQLPESREPGPVLPRDAETPAESTARRERLLDLAYDVASYLRHHAEPAVRVSAALLLAASLAACQGSPSGTNSPAGVTPLAQEVRSGLPQHPGTYRVVGDSLRRDPQGVYHFRWLPEDGASTIGTPASVSLLQLAQGETTQIEMPGSGAPILHLAAGTPILMTEASTTPSTRSATYWRPFYAGGPYLGRGYYDPPPRTGPLGGEVSGGRVSTAPRPAAERTYSAPGSVSGRAGGTGAGAAASTKSGVGVTSPGGKSGALGPRSGLFSSGSAASSKSGASSS